MGFRRGADRESERERVRQAIEGALKQTFRPEFLNRLDETVIFDPLSREQIAQIVGLLLKQVERRLDEQQITIELTEAARDWLAQEGFDPVFGARPLRRAIQRYVENALSNRILAGEVEHGAHVLVDLAADGKGLAFRQAEVAAHA